MKRLSRCGTVAGDVVDKWVVLVGMQPDISPRRSRRAEGGKQRSAAVPDRLLSFSKPCPRAKTRPRAEHRIGGMTKMKLKEPL